MPDLLLIVQVAAAVLTIANASVGLWNQIGNRRRRNQTDRETVKPAGA